MLPIEDHAVLASQAPIIGIANAVIKHGIDSNATEIHLEPGPNRMEVYFRVDSQMQRQYALPARIYPALVTRYKVMAEVSWASRHQPARGHIALRHKGRFYDLDVTFPLRLLEPKITISITPGPAAERDDEEVYI
jgi:type II secretory ATPase GspE/PulE/Tfp pilus assembly ATPase PilB-like protein